MNFEFIMTWAWRMFLGQRGEDGKRGHAQEFHCSLAENEEVKNRLRHFYTCYVCHPGYDIIFAIRKDRKTLPKMDSWKNFIFGRHATMFILKAGLNRRE